jgi:hypothetical protein
MTSEQSKCRTQSRCRTEMKSGSSGRRFTRRDALKGGLALGTCLTAGTFGIIGKASAAAVTMRFGSDSPIGAAPHQIRRGSEGAGRKPHVGARPGDDLPGRLSSAATDP